MTVQATRDLPWCPERTRLAMRGRAVLRVAAGEAPEHIAALADVSEGRAEAAGRVDGGPIDRAIRRFSPAARVTRAFHARRQVGRPGHRHEDFDELEHELGLSRTFRLQVDPDASVLNLVQELLSLGIVELASPHYLCEAPFNKVAATAKTTAHAPDPLHGHRRIGAEAALRMEPGDSSLIIGIVDSGVAMGHAEMTGRLRPGLVTAEIEETQLSRSLKLMQQSPARGQDVSDDMGHGTACAGIIAANGFRIPRGLGGAARVLPMRALVGVLAADRGQPTAVGAIPDIDLAIKTAVDLGARVLNLSFGTPETTLRRDDPVPHLDVVRYALAHDCALVAASGNRGDEVRYFPAALPGVLAVGAVGPGGAPCGFSSRGPHVALCAPGEDIPCAAVDGYTERSGTSFAAPFVAAAAALLLARGARRSVPLAPSLLRELLVGSAVPFGDRAGTEGCGAGVLDVPAALRAVDELCDAARGAA